MSGVAKVSVSVSGLIASTKPPRFGVVDGALEERAVGTRDRIPDARRCRRDGRRSTRRRPALGSVSRDQDRAGTRRQTTASTEIRRCAEDLAAARGWRRAAPRRLAGPSRAG